VFKAVRTGGQRLKREPLCCCYNQVPPASEPMCTRDSVKPAALAGVSARHQAHDVDGADKEALDHWSEVLLRRADSPIRLPQPAPGPGENDDGEKQPRHQARGLQGCGMLRTQEYPSSPPKLDLGGCGPWQVGCIWVGGEHCCEQSIMLHNAPSQFLKPWSTDEMTRHSRPLCHQSILQPPQ
jgi:hypothetical protein